jgi:hypothetical protein
VNWLGKHRVELMDNDQILSLRTRDGLVATR